MNERLFSESQETKIPSSEETQEGPGVIPANRTYVDGTSDFGVLEDATTEENPRQDWFGWFDAETAFFDAYPTAEIPTTGAVLARVERGTLTEDTLRTDYERMLTQYDALQPVLNEALASFGVALPSRATFAVESPRMRRALEQQISEKLRASPTQFVLWIDKMVTRLTLITESCSTYEEVADELEISLTPQDVDSVEKAA